jgi:hypothetical protein
MTVEVPEPLAGRLAAEAARRGMQAEDLAVEAIEGFVGTDRTAEPADERDPLDAFIACGSSGITEPFDIHEARADLAARRTAEGA